MTDPAAQRRHFAELRSHGIHISDAAALTGETVARVEAGWRRRGWVMLGPHCLELAPVLRFLKASVKSAGQEMNPLQKQRARKARVEADEAEGRVLSRETVDREMLGIVHALKRALRTIPGRIAAQCPGTTAAQMQVVRDSIDDALTEAHAMLTGDREDTPSPEPADDLARL